MTAAMWLKIASASGSAAGGKYLEELEDGLNAAALQRADQLAAEWLQRHR